MKRLAIAAALLCVMTSAALAQGNRNRPVGGANVQQTTDIINDCERRSNRFKKTLDKALGNANVKAGQNREDQLNNDAKRLEEQMDKVGDSWNKDHSIDKTRNHVSAAVVNGNDINKAMRTWKMGGDAESEWAALRSELNRLANTFNVPGIR